MYRVNIFRGNIVESSHNIKALVINSNNRVIFSTKNDTDLVYPRSSIKLFQAIPFITSGAADYFKINNKQITLSVSSHFGEKLHIKYLNDWLKKIKIKENNLECGIHNPLNLKSSNELMINGYKPSEIYNNCSGKHLAMITTSKYYRYNIKGYTKLDHPIQKSVLNILENFTDYKVKKNNIAIDGCSLPQYSFPFESLAYAMVKVSCFEKLELITSLALSRMLFCISNNPFFIGGTNRFDTEIIKVTKGRIFCKIGAEGVILFSDLKKKLGGIIKVVDGNQRALPSATLKLLKKIKSINKTEEKKLKKWNPELLFNHTYKKIGGIKCDKI